MSAGFYVEVKKEDWRRIAGPVALKRRGDRKSVLGEMRPGKDGKTIRFRVSAPGSLTIVIGAESERLVRDGEVVKQKDFVVKDEQGTETHVIWSANNRSAC